ncbi:probable zinc metalloprotease EGY2, chloroplastic isoform X1 [Daucus carota subsp. sativus]|uniref:probable zinc metalloprotease EGY2, chloroplastic isoform X1 n=1 Tax=Daucus carota subsp. sativus TaxID=79200 RepID=UPI0007EFB764|nr:PREDICTED: probable zinc metalloprotease EGY2, chloroplastic [Daucus carota subsp. sativus]
MNFSAATFRGNSIPFSCCTSCSTIRSFHPSVSSRFRHSSNHLIFSSKLVFSRNREVLCKGAETQTGPGDNEDKGREEHEEGELPETSSTDSEVNSQPIPADNQENELPVVIESRDSLNDVIKSLDNLYKASGAKPEGGTEDKEQPVVIERLDSQNLADSSGADIKPEGGMEGADEVEVASGSPLPGVKPQLLDERITIPKETIDILRDQVFGFDTFFVTGQEPYEGGVLFKGNLRGEAAKSYEKIAKRLQDRFDDQFKLFLLNNPEDDKPVAVVVPRKTLQPDTAAVPEWFAAAAFGLVTVFTLLLRNVPALQSNLLSIVDNLDTLENGLPGALVTALVLGAHEIGHILVASSSGVKLGVPFFVPSWQIGSFGAITRIMNIVPKRQDLLKVAAAGPLAGFSLGLVLLLAGFYLPPADGIGVIVDASVFHESLLVGGIAKLLLGDVLKEGGQISLNPLLVWAWAGLLINAINSIPAGELDGGRIAFSIWGRKASARFTGASIVLLGLSSLFSDVAFYWVALIFFLQRGPIAPLSEEITDPDNNYKALGVTVLLLGLLVCLPYPFPFSSEAITSF